MRTDGKDVSKCHGLMVRAIFCNQEAKQVQTREDRTPFLTREDEMGGQELADYGVHWDAKRGRGEEAYGHHLIRSLLDRHPDRRYTILQRARGRPDRQGQIRSDQTGPDQTRQTDFGHAHVCFVRGQSGRETLAPLPKLQRLQSPRDFRRFVPSCLEQDERRGVGRAWCLACPLGTGHEARLGPSSAAVAATRDDGYTYYAEDMCCVSDLACVGKEGSTRECGRPPRCADVDAAKLSSMQSAQKEGLSVLALLSAVCVSGM